MENRKIKVIDEHNIDRIANVICTIDVDGSDYVVYSIERDNENDNIFISKLLNNINGTSIMVNIDDSMEKEKMSILVKNFIKYAIDNENDKVDGKVVILPDGKKVEIISSIIEKKEQSINVPKTYITTVKKAVTKVSEDFYGIDLNVDTNENTLLTDIFPVVDDESNKTVEKIEEIAPVLDIPKESNSDLIHEERNENSVKEEVKEESLLVDTPATLDLGEEVKVMPLKSQGQGDLVNTLPSSEEKEINDMAVPIEKTKTEAVMPTPVILDNIPNLLEEESTTDSVVKPIVNEENVDNSQMLVFDGSKESNLNKAIEEVSVDKIIPTENIEPVREFGIDDVKPEEMTDNTISKDKQGFANNKFFMVIAILFFVGACVFLGYEAFRYFQLTK